MSYLILQSDWSDYDNKKNREKRMLTFFRVMKIGRLSI